MVFQEKASDPSTSLAQTNSCLKIDQGNIHFTLNSPFSHHFSTLSISHILKFKIELHRLRIGFPLDSRDEGGGNGDVYRSVFWSVGSNQSNQGSHFPNIFVPCPRSIIVFASVVSGGFFLHDNTSEFLKSTVQTTLDSMVPLSQVG